MNALVSPVETLVDRDSFERVSDDLVSRDPLDFEGYGAALDEKRASGGSDESVVYGAARVGGYDVEITGFDFGFFGGSMGEVAGERLARAIERAIERDVPFVLRTSTGGARMQEGMRSLIQMPKVVAARIELGHAGLPLIAVLGHPTTGGVLASIAALADVTVAESGATVGFAGPRVAERFTGTPLPEGSHTATSAYGNGLVDEIVTTSDAHAYVSEVLKVLAPDEPRDVETPSGDQEGDVDAWGLTEAVRNASHPKAPSVATEAADQSIYLRGDRAGANDDAVIVAIARVAGRRCMVVALDRDHHPGPAAYRKARRALEVAGRLRLPLVTLVDTKGADPSATSEAGGIAWEIARLFEAMLEFPGPVVSVVTGEGGSGGALAFAAADRLVAYRRSIFSVIGPEGAAEILWRDGGRAPEAARALKLTASHLHELGIADEVVDAPFSPESLRYVVATALDATAEGNSRSRRDRWRTR